MEYIVSFYLILYEYVIKQQRLNILKKFDKEHLRGTFKKQW
jgi:hypothetical protein